MFQLLLPVTSSHDQTRIKKDCFHCTIKAVRPDRRNRIFIWRLHVLFSHRGQDRWRSPRCNHARVCHKAGHACAQCCCSSHFTGFYLGSDRIKKPTKKLGEHLLFQHAGTLFSVPHYVGVCSPAPRCTSRSRYVRSRQPRPLLCAAPHLPDHQLNPVARHPGANRPYLLYRLSAKTTNRTEP